MTIEQAALAYLEALGWPVKHHLDIAPVELAAERADFGEGILTQQLQDALARPNPTLPAEDPLKELAWSVMFLRYWSDPDFKEKRQAEFLVRDWFP
jgi:hypothetical protein